MGLNKFDGDETLPSEQEIENMVAAIEAVNCEEASVFYCICFDEQLHEEIAPPPLSSYQTAGFSYSPFFFSLLSKDTS